MPITSLKFIANLSTLILSTCPCSLNIENANTLDKLSPKNLKSVMRFSEDLALVDEGSERPMQILD